MLDLFESVFNYANTYASRIFMGGILLLALEFLLPMSKYTRISHLRGAFFWIIYIVITAAGLILFGKLWAQLGHTPLIHVDVSFLSSSDHAALKFIGGVIAFLAAVQVGEFFYYWFHRFQHTIPFLWRFHAVHHSIREMSAFNSNHHFTEELLRIPFITIPMSFLISMDPGYVPWLFATLMGWQGLYEHSSTKLHLGWFRYFVPDQRFHRIHHVRDIEQSGVNFGSASCLWDIIFRTARFPRKDEWPDVGLDEVDEPKTVKDFLVRPFRNDIEWKTKSSKIKDAPRKSVQAAE